MQEGKTRPGDPLAGHRKDLLKEIPSPQSFSTHRAISFAELSHDRENFSEWLEGWTIGKPIIELLHIDGTV